ncbi:MAG: hypothetical protein V2A73_14795 [Pseudomonadota bacterium]
MALDIVSYAWPEISYSGGSKELVSVRKISPKGSVPTTVVKTLNPDNKAIGFTDGVPEFSVDLDVVDIKATPEVDWFDLMLDKETFLFLYQEGSGGRRHTLVDCRVTNVEKSFETAGEVGFTVTIVALNHKTE